MEQRARAICANCGKGMHDPPRADGRPRWCAALPCIASRVRWLRANDAAYRQGHDAYVRWLRGGKQGPAPAIRVGVRERGVRNPELATQIRALAAQGVPQREIARRVGLRRSRVYVYLHAKELAPAQVTPATKATTEDQTA